MDRSTDGGMAPALQSSNHQSTGLTGEGEVNQAESALLRKKVNGKTYEVDSSSETNYTTETKTGISDKVNKDAELDSCYSSGLKEVAPAVRMPTLQIGQGDSVIGHISDFNGWGESKKSIIDGILQESNNLSVVRLGGKTSVSKISTLKATDLGEGLEISCNGDCENRHSDESPDKCNGHVEDRLTFVREFPGDQSNDSCQGNCKNDSSLTQETVEYKILEVGDKAQPSSPDETSSSSLRDEQTDLTQGPSDYKILGARDKMQSDKVLPLLNAGTSSSSLQYEKTETHGASVNNDAKCGQRIPIKEECQENSSNKSPPIECTNNTASSGSILKPISCQNSSDTNIDGQNSIDTQDSDDKMFLYSNILPGELTGINMSDNLTNALQELAASLKEASFPLQLDVTSELVSRNANNTVNTDNDVNTLRKSAKSLDFCEDDFSNRQAQILDRTNHIVHCAGILEHRLGLLRMNLLNFRSKILKKHVHNQLVAMASHLPKQDWESRPVNVVDADSNSTTDFWQKILENSLDVPSKSTFGQINTHDLEHKGKKLQSNYEHKTSPDFVATTGDTTQLVHLNSSKLPSTEELRELAQEKTGILKKELQYVKSCCDPELTESSSDEDFDEAYDGLQKTKTSSKANTKPRITRYRKSFCRWVTERAEISRKWTWLQSRIAGMEFQIRSQGDLYSHLRSDKGMVRLVPHGTDHNVSTERRDADEVHNCVFTAETQPASSSSPCSINHVLDNVNHQASRLMDKLSPVSGGFPSPVLEMKTSGSGLSVSHAQSIVPTCRNMPLEVEDECARTIALDRSVFKTRKLVKFNQKCLDPSDHLNPATVPNDSSIMCSDRSRSGFRQIANYSSLILKAAVHDHSYHATISSLKDIPLSVSIQAVMKSKHKWSTKSDSNKKDKTKKAAKKVKKHKLERKFQRSSNANQSDEAVERKKRKLASHMSEVSIRKRTAGSMDSDLDSQVIISGFNSYQLSQGSGSGATTPTSEMFASSQNNWKKKKTTEQTFDINNIVIPHGLNSSRIEKLVYKEIQTPSWKVLTVWGPDTQQENKDKVSVNEAEDISDAVFQNRHETYEITEKKKFMSLVQSRRSRRGFRNSTIREPTAQDPASPTIPVSGDSEPSQSRAADVLQNVSSSQHISSTSPTAKPGTVRRLSGDHITREQRPSSPRTLPLSQRNLEMSYAACLSPASPACMSDAGSRRNSHDNPAHVTRTLSCNISKMDEANFEGWEIRSFPLSEDDMKLLNDVEHAKSMLRGSGHGGPMYRSLEGDDGGRQPRAQNLERNQEYAKSGFPEGPRDGVKSAARRRTDSRGSSLASFDDSARHSDASSTSVSSSRRKKKGWHGTHEVSSHKSGNVSGKGSKKLTSSKSKHKYIHVRLSETDDSSTDSEGDSTDSSYTSDDAGHLIDDFADPEWEVPRHREKR